MEPSPKRQRLLAPVVGGRVLGRLKRTWQGGVELNKKREAWPTVQRGEELFSQGPEDEAYEFLTEAVQRFPDNAEIRLLYAYTLLSVRPEDGVAEAIKAAELDPDEPIRLTRIAGMMLRMGRPELARKYAAQARELGGDDFFFAPELTRLEADFALQDGDEEAAEKGYRRAVELEPHNEALAVDLAEFLAERGRRVEAMEVVERALQTAKSKDELTRVGEELGEKA
jgi:Flp pilus assembly protein TadD